MSAFHDVAFPAPLALGASGGPERRTDVTALGSGREVRNTPWRYGRRRYDVGGAVRHRDDLYALIAFFEARRGRLHAFRFRDFLDFSSRAPSQAITALDQQIGVGDGAAVSFPLTKSYGEPGYAYVRAITKPQADSVRVAVNGVEVSSAAFSVDALTGLVTLDAAPAEGAIVRAGFLFDTPVRFDVDRLDLSMDAFAAGRAPSIPLIETLD